MRNIIVKSVLPFLLCLLYFNTSAQKTIQGRTMCYTENYNETTAKQYFMQNMENLGLVEGIWTNGSGWTFAIEKDYNGYTRNENKYRAIILSGLVNNAFWENGDIQFFLENGVSQGLYNCTYYMVIADWSSGKREYNLKPIRGIGEIQSYASLAIQVPEYDDYGQQIGSTVEKFFRLYPSESNFIASHSKSNTPKEWTGTGFALKNGYVVTNYHVIEDANEISIFGINGDFNAKYDAQVMACDKINDLALLKVKDPSFDGFGALPYSVLGSTMDVGENIYVLGYPLTATMGDEIKLTTGVISAKTGFMGDVALYQISAPIQPGNSGGPLFNEKGNIIGVVSAKHSDAENVGYAIKSMYLINLIESSANSSIIPKTSSSYNRSLKENVKVEKDFIFLIKCYK